jgi:hypothetical protein
MKRIILYGTVLLFALGCSKDKFETKPRLEIASVDQMEVPYGGSLTVTLKYFDKEGDLDSLFASRERINVKSPKLVSFYPYRIPRFPPEPEAELEYFQKSSDLRLELTGISIPGSGGQFEPDTLHIRFVAKDKAGNYSDTAILRNVIVHRQ